MHTQGYQAFTHTRQSHTHTLSQAQGKITAATLGLACCTNSGLSVHRAGNYSMLSSRRTSHAFRAERARPTCTRTLKHTQAVVVIDFVKQKFILAYQYKLFNVGSKVVETTTCLRIVRLRHHHHHHNQHHLKSRQSGVLEHCKLRQ